MIKKEPKRLMTDKTVTPEPPKRTCHANKACCVAERFDFNFKVPKDLREFFEKESSAKPAQTLFLSG